MNERGIMVVLFKTGVGWTRETCKQDNGYVNL
jgi:hypothetical protein